MKKTVNIDRDLHQKIKTRASSEGKKISEYVEEALIEKLKEVNEK
ncbi:MAG: hypothetical protein OEL89_00130 [Candidatus Peregrinibacteria bacterium]|nr:hypothetical protein [Candidatus Peregrinibacteria bacterium]